MRHNPEITYRQKRCAVTRRLRWRAQAAEAETARICADCAAAVTQAQDEAAAAEARAAQIEQAVAGERAAMVAFTESPDWQRDLLVMARDRVRAELLALSTQRTSCEQCGSFGRGFLDGLFQAEIDALTAEHALDPVAPLDAAEWPAVMGYLSYRGKRLDGSWHTPEPTRATRAGEQGGGQSWRPPHWRDAQTGGLSGMY